jgi:hypothetical protein
MNSSLRFHFHDRLLRVLAKISEPLISYVAVWKQLHLNQWFTKECHRVALVVPITKLIESNLAVKSVTILRRVRRVPGSNIGTEFDYPLSETLRCTSEFQ